MNEHPEGASNPATDADGAPRWTPPSPEHLQAVLPQYDQWTMIACGGMGAVYKARQVSLDRPVAIKVLPPQVAQNEAEYVTRFKNEARTMARLNHAAIVSVYDFGETSDGLLYIVMEFIDGTDVFKMIHAQKKLPPEHALAITAHVCDALGYAHERGVVHRDIKPANILINMEGAVKVADFGLASMLDPSAAQEGTTMGTPDYVAPEVLIEGATVDGRADLYAVGVMLYNMLTGKIPREHSQPPSERVGCDKRYDAIVKRAMEHDPIMRYQTSLEIRRDLDQILTVPVAKDKPAEVRAAGGMMPRPPAPPPRPAGPPWGMMAAAAAVIGGAAFLLMRSGETPKPAPVSTPPVVEAAPAKAAPAKPEPAPPKPQPAPTAPTPAPAKVTAAPADPKAPTGSALSLFPVLSHGGHYYQVVGEVMNQSDAQEHALSLGAHLATINSQAEQDWMDRTLPAYLQQVPQNMATLGGIRDKGTWRWITGEPFEYARWADAEEAAADPEKAYSLKITARSADKVEWGPGYLNSKRAYVLEWDTATPKPSVPAPASPPQPVAESAGTKRLRELDASFHAALERDVLAIYRAAFSDLNTKYLAALDRAQASAMASARLTEALALREEKQRITEHQPLPAEDAPDMPSSLKTLRSTYRASLRPIEIARSTKVSSLFDKYEEVLRAEQVEWAKAGRMEDTKLVSERLARLPRERTTLYDEAKELLPGGRELVLQKGGRFTSAETFTPPVEFTIVAKTQRENLRMAYTAKQLIFNWEKNPDELRLDADPGGGRHAPGKGRIPEDTFVTITWRILPHMQSISVDGKQRYLHFGDYSKVDRPLEVFPLDHTVTIKSAKVKVMQQATLEDEVSSVPAMREPLLSKTEWTGRLTLPAGSYHPLRRIDIGAPGKNNLQNQDQRGDVTSQPGTRIENVRFHLREGSWKADGGWFHDVRITADLGGSFEASNSLFQDCQFAKEGPWYIAYFSSKWHFTNCVLTGSFMQHWKILDVGMKLESCTLIDVDLAPLGYREDAGEEATREWLSIKNCRFINCRVPESFALATKDCVFEKCTFGGPEETLPIKTPLNAVIYTLECTNQPQAGAGRSIEVKPASALGATAGASLPFVFKNGQLDFQSSSQ